MKSLLHARLPGALVLALAVWSASQAAAGRQEDPSHSRPPSAASAVDINTADAATLETLPGVTPDLSTAIIASRPYRTVEDLARVSGVDRKLVDALRGKVTASPVEPPATKPDTSTVMKESRPPAVDDGKALDRNSPAAMTAPGTGGSVLPHAADTSHALELNAPVTRIDLNTATKEELETLPGVGPMQAENIIHARPFASASALEHVKGISRRTYEAVKDRVFVH